MKIERNRIILVYSAVVFSAFLFSGYFARYLPVHPFLEAGNPFTAYQDILGFRPVL